MAKERLDILVHEKGFAETREKAQRLIRAGKVQVDGVPADKPGHKFDSGVNITVSSPPDYVSRGGYKLAEALRVFKIDVKGLICLDVGASTGGFTDCLLKNGADRVYAVDVGKGQISWALRNDHRVVVMEGINARYLSENDLPEKPQFACVDVSFISLKLILPAMMPILAQNADIVTLIKPQFEAGREQVGKGGVVRDPSVHEEVLEKIRTFGVNNLSVRWMDSCPSPIKGPAGNIEFLAWWRKQEDTLT